MAFLAPSPRKRERSSSQGPEPETEKQQKIDTALAAFAGETTKKKDKKLRKLDVLPSSARKKGGGASRGGEEKALKRVESEVDPVKKHQMEEVFKTFSSPSNGSSSSVVDPGLVGANTSRGELGRSVSLMSPFKGLFFLSFFSFSFSFSFFFFSFFDFLIFFFEIFMTLFC